MIKRIISSYVKKGGALRCLTICVFNFVFLAVISSTGLYLVKSIAVIGFFSAVTWVASFIIHKMIWIGNIVTYETNGKS